MAEVLISVDTPTASARFESPWRNPKLLLGLAMIGFILLATLVGRLLWDTDLARATSSPLNLPPFWLDGGTLDHPFGTENSGRDMLALVLVGSPTTLQLGLIVGITSVAIGTVLGFAGGYLGGWVDTVVRVASDTAMTIPALAILTVVAAFVQSVDVASMALIIALLAWAGPTRLIRAQVLVMREQGYVKMARLSAMSTRGIMFGEMMPNLLPYLAVSFIGGVSGGILTAVGLEALGLGPQRIPTLGTTVADAIEGAAIVRGMWWWWGIPATVLIFIFIALFLIAVGLEEVVNPRLRGRRGWRR